VIDKIFSIKKRDEKKLFSIIAPSFDRIEKEFPQTNIVELKNYLNTYHGVTYIFDQNKPGVRIIKHPFQTFVELLGEPFITTSCNISGEPVVTDIQDIPEEIADNVDYIIDGGIL
jgi:tRNA A37 threonylcarbamoyladenosine synthetase subunit TsaC/SUA5/YrdC